MPIFTILKISSKCLMIGFAMIYKNVFAILDRPRKNLSNFWNYQASPIGITKRLMRMIIYEAHRGLYELTVYVSKTNKGHTRPTAATAEARSKKYLATQVAASSFFWHTTSSSFLIAKNSRLFPRVSVCWQNWSYFLSFFAWLRNVFYVLIICVAVGQYALSIKCGKIQMLLASSLSLFFFPH